MAREGTSVGDLKIANAALAEMAEAFRVFRPYRHIRKLTMFGSARTKPEDPVYVLARDLAARLAAADWMVVTGAGPGIMAAGLEGAGREHAFGVNIRLPHEEDANPFIAQDPKLVEMRYFFTRKLMLIKESHAYAILPGGFGTQDESFELLTLLQTGKAEPAPVVMVETPGGTYWHAWLRFVEEEAIAAGWVSPEDRALFKVTNTMEEAAEEVLGFYRNYHSCRWVGDLLVLRVQSAAEQGRAGRAQPALRRHRRPREHPHRRARSRPSATTTPSCPGWPSASTASTTPGCASSSTPSTSARGDRRRGLGAAWPRCSPSAPWRGAGSPPRRRRPPDPRPTRRCPSGRRAVGANAVTNPNAPVVGMAATPDGGGLLAGGPRRRHLRLRRRAVLRLDRRAGAQRAGRRHGGHARRRRLLAGGPRRRHLQLRRRRLLRLGRLAGAQRAGRRHGRDPRRPGATGSSPPTGASSATATPASAGSAGSLALNAPVVGHGGHPRRRRLLAGGVGRRRLHLRRRGVLRLGRRRSPLERADRRHGGGTDGGGYWLVARDGGRLQLRRRPLLRVARAGRPCPGPSSGWPPRRRAAATGSRSAPSRWPARWSGSTPVTTG